jgi:hypothetical protein
MCKGEGKIENSHWSLEKRKEETEISMGVLNFLMTFSYFLFLDNPQFNIPDNLFDLAVFS